MPLKKGIPMEDKKNKPKKKQIYTVLMLICVVVFLFALYKVVTIIMDYKAIDDYYDKANEEFVTIQDDGQKINVDFQQLREINDDVSGWIYPVSYTHLTRNSGAIICPILHPVIV